MPLFAGAVRQAFGSSSGQIQSKKLTELRRHVARHRFELAIVVAFANRHTKRDVVLNDVGQILKANCHSLGQQVVGELCCVLRQVRARLVARPKPKRHLICGLQLIVLGNQVQQATCRTLARSIKPRTGFRGIECLTRKLRTSIKVGSRLQLPTMISTIDELFTIPGQRMNRAGQS